MRGVVNEVVDSDLGLGKGALLGIKVCGKGKANNAELPPEDTA